MPLVLYQSKDFAETIYPIWSGDVLVTTNAKLYADTFDVYLVGLHSIVNTFLTRIDTSSNGANTEYDLDLPTDSAAIEMTHYFNDFGFAMYSVAIESMMDQEIYATIYPEYPDTWIALPPSLPESAIDVVFPDMPDDPRFVVGFSGNSMNKVYVLLASTSGLAVRYPTNWSAMVSGSAVKDLEVVRFI